MILPTMTSELVKNHINPSYFRATPLANEVKKKIEARRHAACNKATRHLFLRYLICVSTFGVTIADNALVTVSHIVHATYRTL